MPRSKKSTQKSTKKSSRSSRRRSLKSNWLSRHWRWLLGGVVVASLVWVGYRLTIFGYGPFVPVVELEPASVNIVSSGGSSLPMSDTPEVNAAAAAYQTYKQVYESQPKSNPDEQVEATRQAEEAAREAAGRAATETIRVLTEQSGGTVAETLPKIIEDTMGIDQIREGDEIVDLADTSLSPSQLLNVVEEKFKYQPVVTQSINLAQREALFPESQEKKVTVNCCKYLGPEEHRYPLCKQDNANLGVTVLVKSIKVAESDYRLSQSLGTQSTYCGTTGDSTPLFDCSGKFSEEKKTVLSRYYSCGSPAGTMVGGGGIDDGKYHSLDQACYARANSSAAKVYPMTPDAKCPGGSIDYGIVYAGGNEARECIKEKPLLGFIPFITQCEKWREVPPQGPALCCAPHEQMLLTADSTCDNNQDLEISVYDASGNFLAGAVGENAAKNTVLECVYPPKNNCLETYNFEGVIKVENYASVKIEPKNLRCDTSALVNGVATKVVGSCCPAGR